MPIPARGAVKEITQEEKVTHKILEALDAEELDIRLNAIVLYRDLELNNSAIIQKAITDTDWQIRLAIARVCSSRQVSLAFIQCAAKDEVKEVRALALSICKNKRVPANLIINALSDTEWTVRREAFEACNARTDIPLHYIEQGVSDPYYGVRERAAELCFYRDDCSQFIPKLCNDEAWQVRCAIIRSIKATGINTAILKEFLSDTNEIVQYAAETAVGE